MQQLGDTEWRAHGTALRVGRELIALLGGTSDFARHRAVAGPTASFMRAPLPGESGQEFWLDPARDVVPRARFRFRGTPAGTTDFVLRPVAHVLGVSLFSTTSESRLLIMHLWPHQTEALAQIAQSLSASTSRFLVQLPPGTGKTEIAIHAALNWVKAAPFRRALIAAPTTPILQQHHHRLAALTRLLIGVEKATVRASPRAKIVLASQATLWSRVGEYPSDTLFLLDECHHANHDAPENLRLVKRFAHVVGLSATPWSAGCRALFERAGSYVLPLPSAQERRLVAPIEICPWEPPRGPWGLVFCASNQDSAARAADHPGSAWIGVELPPRTIDQHVRAWKAGRVPVLYANRMLLEGFDEPRCANVWIDKPCDSPIMLAQMAGRVLRYQEGKVARVYCRTLPDMALLVRLMRGEAP